jgi:putative hydrolase of the HAD superfamily
MTAILFDFFGTLVSYSPSRTTQGYPRSHALVPHLSYAEFLSSLDACFAALDAATEADHREFSMAEAVAAYLGRPESDPLVAEFERTYIAEWSTGVTHLDGLPDLLAGLRSRHRLAVVSNTHSPSMVPGFLAELGLADLFDAVVLSVHVGRRKPHPAMYAAALHALAVPPAGAVFVGDSHVADYLGPTSAGIHSYLIGSAADVPAAQRLDSVFDLPARLAIRE